MPKGEKSLSIYLSPRHLSLYLDLACKILIGHVDMDFKTFMVCL
jgi:hypothetical protein